MTSTSERVTSERLYEWNRGGRALQRQLREGEQRFPCCGERRTDGHHPLCKNYVMPEVEQQETLF